MNRGESFLIGDRFPNVVFGTSGVRALVTDLRIEIVATYVYAFMQRMCECHAVSMNTVVAVGMDLRPSSPDIAAAVCTTLQTLGYQSEFLGTLPTPALALRCLSLGQPGVMITGSHIPFDRNGLKFYSPIGEILKADEDAISSIHIPIELINKLSKKSIGKLVIPPTEVAATDSYVRRYVDFFGVQCLAGKRIGLYEHSAVGRDVTHSILIQLGAEVIPLGRSDEFVPIDTEAVSDVDIAQAHAWCKEFQLDALVSTDGDGDRPLVFDEKGEFVRGDLLGLLCARQLEIKKLVVPVSCNSAIEKSGYFSEVIRTKIGSPFVIAGINELSRRESSEYLGTGSVAGFEANGGFLLGSSAFAMTALPTRDALLPMLSLLVSTANQQCAISSLLANLPKRYTYSDRLKNFSNELSSVLLNRLASDSMEQSKVAGKTSAPSKVNLIDGVRLTFADDDIVHLRASGNAPELRCYAEAASIEEAKFLCTRALVACENASVKTTD